MWVRRKTDVTLMHVGVVGSNGDWASPDPGFANASIRSGIEHQTANYGVAVASGPATARWRRGLRDRDRHHPLPSGDLPEHVYASQLRELDRPERVPRDMQHAPRARHQAVSATPELVGSSSRLEPLERRLPNRANANQAAVGCGSQISPTPANTIFSARSITKLKPSLHVAEPTCKGSSHAARRLGIRLGQQSDCQYGMNEAFAAPAWPMNLKSPGRT